jgi:hypothetical protein
VKERRKPVRGGEAVDTVAGSLPAPCVSRVNRGLRGALVDGRRPDRWRSLSLTRRRWKRIWRSHPTPSGPGPWVAFAGVSALAGVDGLRASAAGERDRDRGRQRVGSQPRPVAESSRRRGALPEGLSIAAPARTEQRPIIAAASPPGGSGGDRTPSTRSRRVAVKRRSARSLVKKGLRKRPGSHGARGSRTTRWVLVSEIGCRHRGDASSLFTGSYAAALALRRAGPEQGSLKRPSRPLAGRARFVAGEQVRGEACECQKERVRAHCRCEAVAKPMEGALVRIVVVLLTRGDAAGPGAAESSSFRVMGRGPNPGRSRAAAEDARGEAWSPSPRSAVRHGASEVRTSGSGFLSRWAQEVGGQRGLRVRSSPCRAGTTTG